MEKRKRQSVLNGLAFVLRCTGSSVAAYLLAASVGLEHPVWAAMSSLIVSQDDERATEQAAMVRVLGTCAGILISLSIGSAPFPQPVPVAVNIGLSVAICAIFTLRFPSMRVAMWTAPLVYLSLAPGTDLWHSGLWRGLEVLLGAVIGAVFHWASSRAVNAFR